ncbi:MAG: hypothetical protein Q9180_006191 [Flavoplaca navasiana]
MAAVTKSPCLTWVNYSDGLRPKNPKIDTLIRRQAMHKAAAARRHRRHRPTWWRQDSSQLRVHPHNCEAAEEWSEVPQLHDVSSQPLRFDVGGLDSDWSMLGVPETSELTVGDMPKPNWIPVSPSSTGFEAMRIRLDFDPISLSGLTSLHVSPATARPLRDKPVRLLEILRARKSSYYDYLPSRFGHTKCLDDAVQCVAARVRQWLDKPAGPNRLALELYSKAVRSLQAALEDPLLCRHPDVLCAAEIMIIFELLDTGRDALSTPHIKGVETLIEFRGPQGYQTEFEKLLFLAQWAPLYTEAIHNNTHCLLEKPAWQATLQSIIVEKSASLPYANGWATLWACMGAIPDLFRSIQYAVFDPYEVSNGVQAILLARAYQLRSRMMDAGMENGLTNTKMHGTETYSFILPDDAEGTQRYEILGALAINLMKVERYIVALDPSSAVLMEAHAQQLAMQILDLEYAATKSYPQAMLFLASKSCAARGVLLTASDWRYETLSQDPKSMIAKPVFERWLSLGPPERVADEWRNKYGEKQYLFDSDSEV